MRNLLLAGTVGVLLIGHAAQAADPPQGGVVGQDVMGDKSRSGPDGWSWAPVTRNQAPSASGAAAGQNAANAPNTRPDPGAGRTLPPGQDPGTPATPQAQGPGTLDRPAQTR